MSKTTGVLIGGGVVLLAVAIYLVISLPGKKAAEEAVEPPEKAAKREAPARFGPSAGLLPVDRNADAAPRAAAPAGLDSGPSAKSTDDAKPNRLGTAAKASPAQLAREAKVKQRDLYRASIASSNERIEKLTKVIERLRKTGGAGPEQLTQIQRQLQQQVDALPRMKERLQKLEEEVQADQEQAEREKKQAEEEK